MNLKLSAHIWALLIMPLGKCFVSFYAILKHEEVMKRISVILVVLLLGLIGCSNEKKENDTSEESSYATYYKVIEDNDKFITASDYYTLSAEMTALEDGTYRYYIFLDEPQVAMYDVKMMAVINHISYSEANIMMPTIGIFDTQSYHLVPYQSNNEAGYMKGLILSGESDQAENDVQLLVEWYDVNHQKSNREFLSFQINLDGMISQEDNNEETNAQVDES